MVRNYFSLFSQLCYFAMAADIMKRNEKKVSLIYISEEMEVKKNLIIFLGPLIKKKIQIESYLFCNGVFNCKFQKVACKKARFFLQ